MVDFVHHANVVAPAHLLPYPDANELESWVRPKWQEDNANANRADEGQSEPCSCLSTHFFCCRTAARHHLQLVLPLTTHFPQRSTTRRTSTVAQLRLRASCWALFTASHDTNLENMRSLVASVIILWTLSHISLARAIDVKSDVVSYVLQLDRVRLRAPS